MKKDRYYLFTSEAHEDVRLDFTNKTIDRFIKLWGEGRTHKDMSGILKVSEMELVLIALDLNYTGRLPVRENGFWGLEDE